MHTSEEVVWVDRNYRRYKTMDISDSHLINILLFLCKGGGYIDFLSESKIKSLFEEAGRRELRHSCDVKEAIRIYNERVLISHLREVFEDDCW